MKTEIAKQSQRERKAEQIADRKERMKELSNDALRQEYRRTGLVNLHALCEVNDQELTVLGEQPEEVN
jgi:hypothetical protein